MNTKTGKPIHEALELNLKSGPLAKKLSRRGFVISLTNGRKSSQNTRDRQNSTERRRTD